MKYEEVYGMDKNEGCYVSSELAIVVPRRTLVRNFSVNNTGQDVLEVPMDPGLRFALNASPYGRRRATLQPPPKPENHGLTQE